MHNAPVNYAFRFSGSDSAASEAALEKGANVELSWDVKGGHGHEAIVKLLLEKGAEKLLH